MHYTLSLTSRMLTIAVICFILLCVLMFLLGMEIGRSLPAKGQPTISVPVPATGLNSIPKELPLEGVK
jgi:hypothetical protein